MEAGKRLGGPSLTSDPLPQVFYIILSRVQSEKKARGKKREVNVGGRWKGKEERMATKKVSKTPDGQTGSPGGALDRRVPEGGPFHTQGLYSLRKRRPIGEFGGGKKGQKITEAVVRKHTSPPSA